MLTCKVSLCFIKHNALKTHWGSGGTSPRVLNTCMWVFRSTPLSLYPRQVAPLCPWLEKRHLWSLQGIEPRFLSRLARSVLTVTEAMWPFSCLYVELQTVALWDVTCLVLHWKSAGVSEQHIACLPPFFTPVSCSSYSSTLKMEGTCSPETSVDFQWSTRRYIPEDNALHNHRC
jgi:hypothetical protein